MEGPGEGTRALTKRGFPRPGSERLPVNMFEDQVMFVDSTTWASPTDFVSSMVVDTSGKFSCGLHTPTHIDCYSASELFSVSGFTMVMLWLGQMHFSARVFVRVCVCVCVCVCVFCVL